MQKIILSFIVLFFTVAQAATLPTDFVYLKNVDPSILQDMRYAEYHNFIGRPIAGYQAKECILNEKAALALHHVQLELKKSDLSLKVYDCYRPQMAVDDFVQWSQMNSDQTMKAEFYPNVDKSKVFELGYIAKKSGHTRGSTVDLTIVPIPSKKQIQYHRGQKLVACFSPYKTRYQDNSIDMGTGFDCFDPKAYGDNQEINLIAFHNRQLLRDIMGKYDFLPYEKEWWHFTLKNESYPETYFNFLVS